MRDVNVAFTQMLIDFLGKGCIFLSTLFLLSYFFLGQVQPLTNAKGKKIRPQRAPFTTLGGGDEGGDLGSVLGIGARSHQVWLMNYRDRACAEVSTP